MKGRVTAVLLMLVLVGAGGAFAQNDLFEEAGHALGHSRWITVRLIPAIEIALESDDVVLVRSVDHPAKSFAMRIDGKATAADCEVTETKDSEFTVATQASKKWATGSTTTTTIYWAMCQFPGGTSKKAVSAREIVVQVAMTNGSTSPHPLKPKALGKFQRLDK